MFSWVMHGCHVFGSAHIAITHTNANSFRTTKESPIGAYITQQDNPQNKSFLIGSDFPEPLFNVVLRHIISLYRDPLEPQHTDP